MDIDKIVQIGKVKLKQLLKLQSSGTVKTNELSKQIRDKVLEKYRSGLGYKKYQRL